MGDKGRVGGGELVNVSLYKRTEIKFTKSFSDRSAAIWYRRMLACI